MEECERASQEGNGFLLQGDLNAWLGHEIIKGDKRQQNQNGKMLANFVKSNNLTIVNSLDICKGTTTWSRVRNGTQLSSTLDYFIVCEQVLPFVKEMVIDQEGKHTLTNFKDGNRTTKADHATMWLKVNLKITPETPEKIEILNFRDKKAQKKFREATTNTTEFSDCFKSNLSSKDKMKIWKHTLEKHCNISFRKIRIRKKTLKPSEADKFINTRNTLLKMTHEDNTQKINDLNVIIADIIAKEEKLKCHRMKKFCDQSGSTNLTEMWKLKKKIWPKAPSSLPAAKINHTGKLVSIGSDIKKTMIKEYKERLRP